MPQLHRPYRLLIDTNIAVSALLWGGLPRELLRHAFDPDQLILFSSFDLLDELARVLAYPKIQKRVEATGLDAGALVFHFRNIVTLVETGEIPEIVTRDPDDNLVVAAALTGRVDAIVSGDDDLLSLGDRPPIPVLKISEAMQLFA